MSKIELITLTEADLGRVQMFCGHSPTYRRGYDAKMEWLRDRLREGMRYNLLTVDGHNAGMTETVPGEFAWRGVEAKGYLFIHCFWVIGRNRGHGYGRQLLEACNQDAAGMDGVAVMSSRTHWLPTRKIFLKNGFEVADEMHPFELLVKRFNPQAALPRFKRSAGTIPLGLVLYKSDQCPYTQNVADIVEKVGGQLKIRVNIIHVGNAREAQEMPSPHGTLGYFYNGEPIEYRPTGTEKLLEILKPKLAPRAG